MDEGSTKTIAAAERHIIERPRLTKILDESNARLILLVAPAGYGKTTLARQWLRDKPHVWYQATPASADPVALARGLERLLGLRKSTTLTLTDILHANPSLAEDPQELAAALFERVRPSPGASLALDDYHLIDNHLQSREFLRICIDHLDRPTLLISRLRPTWVTARMLAYGDIAEITSDLLAMTDNEAAAVIGQSAEARAFSFATGGWPVLVGLASLVERPLPSGEAPGFIYEFLTDELLSNGPPDMEEALTSIALAPSLSDVVRRSRPQAFSEALRRGLIRLYASGTSMHPLLAEHLRKRARGRVDAIDYFREVGLMLLDQGAWDEAFEVIETAPETGLIAQLLGRGGIPMMEGGRTQTVERWLAAARSMGYHGAINDVLESDLAGRRGQHLQAKRLALSAVPRLTERTHRYHALIRAARSAYFSESFDEAYRLFSQAAESAVTEGERREALAGQTVIAVELNLASYDALIAELQCLPQEEPETALRIALAAMMRSCRVGPVQEGLKAAERAAEAAATSKNAWVLSSYFDAYAYLLTLGGYYLSALKMSEEALENGTAAHFGFAILQSKVHTAGALAGLRRYGQATRGLRLVEARSRHPFDAYLAASVATIRMRLAVEQGLAESCLEDRRNFREFATGSATRGELIAMQAVAYACCQRIEQAVARASEAEAISQAIDVRGLAQAARTIASENRGVLDRESARLLQLADRTGNLDACVIALRASERVREAIVEMHSTPTRDAALAAAFPEPIPRADQPSGNALSPREREVLEFVVRGLTNRQIGQALFISDVTVKVHLRHIYEKLGVRTRTEAALLARDLDVL